MGSEALPEQTDMVGAALAWAQAGCSVIQVKTDGTKAPLGEWKYFQTERATDKALTAWFRNGHPGLGIVCGAISGNLELIEFEGRAITDGYLAKFGEAANDAGIGNLWATLVGPSGTYVAASPSGGLHIVYRCDEPVSGNTKLAERFARDEEYTADEVERAAEVLARTGTPFKPRRTLIETRGEGGFYVAPPSHGPVHPTGKPWTALNGATPERIITITAAQREALHVVAKILNEIPVVAFPEPKAPLQPVGGTGLTPGEDFNQRGTWEELLEPLGWRVHSREEGRTFWTRPGKDAIGKSAVTGGIDGDYMYVWSTSTELPAERSMSKWRVFAFIEYGDTPDAFKLAAGELRRRGYGGDRPAPQRPDIPSLHMPPQTGSGPPYGPGGAVPDIGPDGAARKRQRPTERVVTDVETADQLIARHGDVLRFIPERGRWTVWGGTRWEIAHGADSPSVWDMVKAIGKEDTTEGIGKNRFVYNLSKPGISNAIKVAANDRRIQAKLTEFDANPWELNTPNGIVALDTGKILTHNPANRHSKITRVGPDFEADSSLWLKFLDDTFNGDQEYIGYMQRLIGYTVIGEVRHNVLPFCYGIGANGKTVLLETLQAVLGDYATTAPANFLMAQKFGEHSTEVARLAGARLVVCSEVNEADKWDEAKVKTLTGSESITARFMRQDFFTFVPSHTLWLAGNYRPAVTSGGHSFWRRLRLLPFGHVVPEADQIANLQHKLATEYGGAVMAWIVQGAMWYGRDGLREPRSIKAATDEYAKEQDTLGRFIEDRCTLDEHARTPTPRITGAYKAWCFEEGEEPMTMTRLGRELRSRYNVGLIRANGVRIYSGVRVNDGIPTL